MSLGLALLAGGLAAQAVADDEAAAPDRAQGPPIPGRPAADTAAAAAVTIRGDTVLFVSARSGAFTAEERAAAIAARVLRLTRTAVDSLTVDVGEAATDILAGDVVLMSVSDADAAGAGVTRDSLVRAYRDALHREIGRVSLRETIRRVALGSLFTALATALLVLLLRLLRRGSDRLGALIERRRRGGRTSISVRSVEVLSADSTANVLQTGITGLRWLVIAVLLYVYLPLVLSFFPWTEQYADRLLSYLLTPLGQVARSALNYLPNIFFIAVIVAVGRVALKVIRLLFNAVEHGTLSVKGFEREWADPTYKIVRFLVIAFMGVVLFPYLPGAKSDAFKGVSLFLGVLVSFGSSSAIANIVAGVVLTYTRAFNVGDRVQIGETTGDVVAKTLLVTRVRTIKNVDVTIPNAMVLGAHVLNFTAVADTSGLILHTAVTIGYDVPWRQVHELLIAAARATPDLMEDPEPFVLQKSLDDFYVSYELNAYTEQPKRMARTYGALHANIQDAFAAAGVEIMSPHYKALRDGNTAALPADRLPAGYRAPAFRVQSAPGTER